MRTRVLAVCILAAVLGGCSGSSQKLATIKVGWLGALTGDNADWGQSELNSIKLMFDDIDGRGGLVVVGRAYRLEVVPYDDRGDGGAAESAARKLTSVDRVTAIVGPMFSREAIPVSQVVKAASTPCIATTATGPAVTLADRKVNPYMFRACFLDPYEGQAAAIYAYKRFGARTAAILMKLDDGYSLGLAEYFNESFRGVGGKVVASAGYRGDGVDFESALRLIKAAYPDIIFIPDYDKNVALMANQARRMRMTTVMMGGDKSPSANLLAVAGKSLEGSLCVSQVNFDDPAVQDYRAGYRKAFGKEPEMPGYLAHDAVLMLLDALKRAQSLDGTAIAKALESCDIQGITGHIAIDAATHGPQDKQAAIMKIVKGRFVFQGWIDPASAP